MNAGTEREPDENMQVRTGTLPEHIDRKSDDAERDAIQKLMDPDALEARLAVARARRAEVLAAKAEAARLAEEKRTAPAALEPVPSDAPTGARAAPTIPEGVSRTFGLAAGLQQSALANARPDPSAAGTPTTARAARPDPDRRKPAPVPTPPAAEPDAAPPDALPQDAVAPRRRSPVLIAAILLAGAALGAVSTLALQFQGWQIAIVPPVSDGAPAQGPAPEPETAPIETTDARPAIASPSTTPADPVSAPEVADATPPPVEANDRHGFPEAASDADIAQATVARPASGTPIPSVALPELARSDPDATSNPRIAALPGPGPAPSAAPPVQAPPADMEPALPTGLQAAPGSDLATPAPGAADIPSQPSLPREDAPLAPPPQTDRVPPAEVATAEADPAPVPVAAASKIAVHFPALFPAEADKLSAELTRAGFDDVTAYPASIRISTTQVRYYHEADRAAAEEIAASTSTAFDGATVAVRSFTDAGAQPPEGLLEIWLEGDGTPAAAPRTVRAAGTSNTTGTSQGEVERAAAAAQRVTQEERARQRLVGAVEQLLRDQLQ